MFGKGVYFADVSDRCDCSIMLSLIPVIFPDDVEGMLVNRP